MLFYKYPYLYKSRFDITRLLTYIKQAAIMGYNDLYSTQRAGSIDEDILTQTENFFVMHVGSEEDAARLTKAKIAFASPISDFILTEPAVGVAYIYSEPYQPYVLSCKVRKFDDVLKDTSEDNTAKSSDNKSSWWSASK